MRGLTGFSLLILKQTFRVIDFVLQSKNFLFSLCNYCYYYICVTFGILVCFAQIFFGGLCSACLLLRMLKKVKELVFLFYF